MPAYVPVVQVTDVRVPQGALQALDRKIRPFPFQPVQIVHRVTVPYSRLLQVIRLYARLRVHLLRSPALDDPRRERSHADLYLAASLRGQQLHLQNRHVLTILCLRNRQRPTQPTPHYFPTTSLSLSIDSRFQDRTNEGKREEVFCREKRNVTLVPLR